jgi:CheY-like chemotaxis protein
VKEVLDLHHTRIDVQSQVGKGTTFRFSMPMVQKPARKGESDIVPNATPAPSQRARQVLVVDDETEVLDWVNTILQDAGHGVRAVTTFRDAERTMAQQNFDVMLLDILLSDGNGIDFLKRLRQQNHPAHVYMITAVADPKIHEEARAAGAQGVLLKPFRVDELLRSIDASPVGSTNH